LEFKSLGEKSYEIKPEELTGGSLILVLKSIMRLWIGILINAK
jgi:hypothetical protein